MAHFRLGGGYVTLAVMAVIYTAVFFGCVCWYLYMEATRGPSPGRATFTAFGVTLMFILQTLNLVVFGSLRIAGAVRGDIASRMIESHRLMPVASWRAVAGYMLGSTAHVLVFAGMTLLFAGGLAMASGASLMDVAFKQAMLLAFTGLMWAWVAMLNLFHRAAFAGSIIGLILGIFSTVAAYGFAYLPALAVLTGPLIGSTVFYFGPATTPATILVYPVSLVGQASFFALFFTAACRCYRGTHRTVFRGWQAMLLTVAWSGMSAAGIALFDAFPLFTRLLYRGDVAHVAGKQVAGSVAAALLVSLIPLYTVSLEWRGRKWGGAVLCAAAVGLSVVITAVLAGLTPGGELSGGDVALTWLTVTPFLLLVTMLCLVFNRSTGQALAVLLVVVTFLVWVGPFVPAGIAHQVIVDPTSTMSQTLSTLSPVGMLVDHWTSDEPVGPGAGLVWQWLMPAALGMYVAVRGLRTRGGSGRGRSSMPTVPV
jgi:hypothetical protein